jgi:hypothetical protein
VGTSDTLEPLVAAVHTSATVEPLVAAVHTSATTVPFPFPFAVVASPFDIAVLRIIPDLAVVVHIGTRERSFEQWADMHLTARDSSPSFLQLPLFYQSLTFLDSTNNTEG